MVGGAAVGLTWERWWFGAIVVAATTLPAFACAPALRRRLVPGWPRAARLPADVTIAVSGIVVMAELLGTAGLLRPVPLLVAGPLLGLAFHRAGRPPEPGGAGDLGLGSRTEVTIAAAAVAALCAQAVNSVLERTSRGILDPDSLHYHLPFAARFAKSGSTTALAYVSPGDGAPYHPATGELLHALGLVAWRVELLTLVLNLGALALALLAAASLGATRGRGAAAVTATAAILALPMLGREQAGSPHNDVLAIAFLLSAVALAGWTREGGARTLKAGLALSGLALGLAVSTKLTTLAPAALVTIVIALEPAARRRLPYLLGPAILTGGYWIVRNLAHVGNPFPAADVGLPRPPMPVLDAVDQTVAHYLTDLDVLDRAILPGLGYALGPAVHLVVFMLVAAAAAAILPPRDGWRQPLGIAMLAGLLVYLVTPSGAGGPEGDPVLFRFNVRYAGPALCVLVGAAALSPAISRRATWWGGAWLLVVAVTLTDGRSWADPDRRVAAVALVLAVAAVVMAARRLPPPRAVIAAVLAAAVVGGGFLARSYVSDWRYGETHSPRDELVVLGRAVEGGRTGVSGLPLQYSYFGPRLEGEAEYVAEVLPGHEVRNPPTCARWREALRRGRYGTVVVLRLGRAPLPPTAAWTASIPGVRTRLANPAGRAYVLPPQVTDAGC